LGVKREPQSNGAALGVGSEPDRTAKSTIFFRYRGYAADLEIPSNAAGPFVRTNALIGTHVSFSAFKLKIVDKYGQMLMIRAKGGGD
jgi:hypothetical protein